MDMNPQIKLIAVAGGIGSGKSVISRVLRVLGYDVYDCDSRAKALMNSSVAIKQRIAQEIAQEAIIMSPTSADINWDEAEIDRKKLSEIVFGDIRKLSRLNSIVHGEVIADVMRWHKRKSASHPGAVFVESAVLFTSGLDRIVDAIWDVTAREETRIKRAMSRDNASAEAVLSRIKSQESERKMLEESTVLVHTIDNNGDIAVLPQVLRLLSEL